MFKACAGCTSNSCNAENILFQAQHVAASCSITSCCISYLSKSLPYAKNNIRLPRAKARLKSRQEFTVNALGRLCLLQLGKGPKDSTSLSCVKAMGLNCKWLDFRIVNCRVQLRCHLLQHLQHLQHIPRAGSAFKCFQPKARWLKFMSLSGWSWRKCSDFSK